VSERWKRLEELLDRALDLEGPARDAFLASLSESEPELTAELRGLLAATEEDSLLDRPWPELPPADPGERIGPWKILQRLGEGGMGAVFLAERADGAYERQAALKLLRWENPAALRAFLLERRALARLEHPGIARMLDAGIDEQGRHYLVMEWIDGENLRAWCRRRPARLGERLHLFLEICDAVAHAHRNLVVHRDLKPSNVMVERSGHARLLDFGIAKLLEAEMEDSRTLAALTPEYAAPEQLRGEPITTRTDVYALGGILFFLLTEESPLLAQGRSLAAVVHEVCNAPPPRPSERAAAAAERAPFPPERLRGDLDAIVVQAMGKRPEWRYPSVEALAEDIRRHLALRPVRARRPTAAYRAGLYLRRNRGRIALAAAFFAAVAFAGGAWLGEREARNEARLAALLESERTQSMHDLLQILLREGEGEDRSLTDAVLERARGEVREIFADRPGERARVLLALAGFHLLRNDFPRALALLEELAAEGASLPAVTRAEIHCSAAQAAARLGDLKRLERHLEDAEGALAPIPEEAASRIRADCLHARSIRLRLVGRPEEAIEVAREAVLQRMRVEGEAGLQVQLLLANLGTSYLAANRLDEAEAAYRRALAGLARAAQDRGAHGLNLRNNLAAVLLLKGEVREAERAFAEVAELHRARLGANPALAAALANRARCLIILERHGEAEALLREALTIAERDLGAESADTAQHRLQLAELLERTDRFSSALAELRAAEPVLAARFPSPTHPVQARARLIRLRLARAAGEEEIGERLLALAAELEGSPPTRPIAALALREAALAAEAAGARVEARAHAKRAQALMEASRGAAHWESALALLLFARLASGEEESLRSRLQGAEALLARQLGEAHPATEEARRLLASAQER
jgi:non-specific serine/threonine protein kinase/serine/threonine-protein kinase